MPIGTTGQVSSFWGGPRLLICSAQTALPFPPDLADCGIINAIGAGQKASGFSEDEFVIRIVAAGDVNLTAASLYALVLEPYTFDDATVTFTHATETVNLNSHGFRVVGPVQYSNSGGALPTGLVAFSPTSTDPGHGSGRYFASVTGANTFKNYGSLTGALTADSADLVSISTDGSGTNTISDFADEGPNRTHAVKYAKIAGLGDDVAGVPTVVLTAHQAYVDGPFVHQPGTIGYCVAATFSGAVAVTISAYPRKKVTP